MGEYFKTMQERNEAEVAAGHVHAQCCHHPGCYERVAHIVKVNPRRWSNWLYSDDGGRVWYWPWGNIWQFYDKDRGRWRTRLELPRDE